MAAGVASRPRKKRGQTAPTLATCWYALHVLSVVVALWAALPGAVNVQVEAAEGLDERERVALISEISGVVGAVTGEPTNGDRLTRLAIRARRVSWRIQLSLERRDGALVRGREDLDLTRDPRSWRVPLSDAIRRLFPEGRELAAHVSPPPSAAVVAAPTAPVVMVDPAGPPASATAPAMAAPPPPPPEAGRGPTFRIVPLLAIAAGVGATVAGTRFVAAASDAINSAPSTLSQAAIEQQQRDVLENAVLGSVLISAGIAAGVTGLILLISD